MCVCVCVCVCVCNLISTFIIKIRLSPVGWGRRTHRLHLCRGVRHLMSIRGPKTTSDNDFGWLVGWLVGFTAYQLFSCHSTPN